MNFKAVLLLCLLIFASVSAMAVASLSIVTSNVKRATFALGLGGVQPCGGDPIDNPDPS
jgi:hypothetical protein